MSKKLFILAVSALVFVGCTKNDVSETPQTDKEPVKNNVEKVFGTKFDANHDWCTTTSGKVVVQGIPAGTTKVQLYALIATEVTDDEGQNASVTSLLKLNEDAVSGSQVTMVYDAPSLNKGILVCYVMKLLTKQELRQHGALILLLRSLCQHAHRPSVPHE